MTRKASRLKPEFDLAEQQYWYVHEQYDQARKAAERPDLTACIEELREKLESERAKKQILREKLSAEKEKYRKAKDRVNELEQKRRLGNRLRFWRRPPIR